LLELAPSRGERELTRRPITHVRDAGFVIDETDRLRAGMIERFVARKPSSDEHEGLSDQADQTP
jgi:hypothetical protein